MTPLSLWDALVRSVWGTQGAPGHDISGWGPGVVRGPVRPDFSAADRDVLRQVAPYTMASEERVVAMCDAVRYIVSNCVVGDVVECGVWKGGSMMAVGLTLLALGRSDINLYLFDTFDGMTPPGGEDLDYLGRHAADRLDAASKDEWIWAVSSLESTMRALYSVKYPPERIHFIRGRVEDTIPMHAPATISLLRLDTDWYASTKHELVHLFPRLSPGGVLIIDDYGHWQGARKAVEEYIQENNIKILLSRIDYTGRMGVKM